MRLQANFVSPFGPGERCPSPSSAPLPFAICSTPASNAQSAANNTNADDAKSDTSSSPSSAISSSEDEQQEHSSEDVQQEHDMPEDEQRRPKDAQQEPEDEQQEHVMPEYAQWSDDWHDVYAQLSQVYRSSELNAKRCRTMDTLMKALDEVRTVS
ncbi:hypothetical protein AK812_SmicGene30921 [Symbiodinium microadriaticum]|uniref:Uncharacterized protein n=1 Tax=Symbiodinium microadriaticum TaxID=2951 RepID=A0A1Q9CY35_SYMMI|nr:hypothetical protein AK812_SmicGene30921 [Symbiodinium microadriaticum]